MFDEMMEHFGDLLWDYNRAVNDVELDLAAQALNDLGAEFVNGKWHYDPEGDD